MRAFAELLDTLVYTPSRNGKLALLERYFRAAPDPDRGWALAALTDGLPIRLPLRRILADLMADKIDPVLYQMSRDYVGDTAETVALLWPEPAPDAPAPPSLSDIVAEIGLLSGPALVAAIGRMLDRMTSRERWALLKLIGGAPRVGVSARIAKMGLARAFGAEVDAIEEVWHGIAPPYASLFAWLEGRGERPDGAGQPLFRPMMLAVPLSEDEAAALDVSAFAAEWKWDGIRVQVVASAGGVRVFSRTGEDVSSAFPEIARGFAGLDVTADGELLVVRDGVVAPFSDLQQRLNRKVVGAKLMRDYPAHVRLYDLLLVDGEDLRGLSFDERRRRLEAWLAHERPPHTDLSEVLSVTDMASLGRLRDGARAASIEGLMLKRRASPYIAGRPKGHWFKWKRDALTLDCVLMYAQRGSGKRSSFYSDYTFGVWREGKQGPELVPVGKAYSGFTDDELKQLDRFIRQNTIETFGPVRSVKPALVLQVAFDAVQASSRHKSGVAMRFPRIERIRWDKPAAEADTLETIKALIASA